VTPVATPGVAVRALPERPVVVAGDTVRSERLTINDTPSSRGNVT
jgi:hypothetical protein